MNATEFRPTRVCFRSLPAALMAVFLMTGPSPAIAEKIIFTIDPSQSNVTWSGNDTNHGTWVPQSPGSDMTSVSGHFLVDFDPSTDTPTSIQFLGSLNGYTDNGFFKFGTNTQGFPGAAPGLSQTMPDPANVAFTTIAPGGFQFAFRNINFDFSSNVINGSGTFPAAPNIGWYIREGTTDGIVNGVASTQNDAGSAGALTSGSWTLGESAPGSGAWTLTGNLAAIIGYHFNNTDAKGTETAAGTFVSTAQFGAANSTMVPLPAGGPVEGQILGGAGTIGGVTIDFSQTTTGGALSVQQVPNNTALTPSALSAIAANPLFLASTSSLSANPQIWDVQYGGSLNGGTASLVFHYDPALLPPGTNQSMLGIWHFSSLRNQWEFGGTVNTLNDTITYVTDGFSPFELGVAVPEPLTLALLAMGAGILILLGRLKPR